MKKILLCLVMALILFSGCGDSIKVMESPFTIKVTGSDKLKFSGHYSFAGTGGLPKPVNVEGTVPAEYKGNGLAALCMIRKTTVEGSLKVEIFKDDKVVSTSETTQPYGIISLGKIPETKSIINQVLGKILG
ncbi:MAG: hypothetical protein NTZ57_06900 [Deltaproteobacteria bacterium]|jgi:hypothetical protein|nr:hypothetical protein [Deltaproteobacteria bacterium]